MAALVVAPPSLLELRFFNLGSPELASVRAQAFLFEGGEVRMLPAGELVGHHAGSHWRVGTGRYLRLEIPQLVKCRLEGGDTEGRQSALSQLRTLLLERTYLMNLLATVRRETGAAEAAAS